jgi:electron transfer flavoprotein alpha subunit
VIAVIPVAGGELPAGALDAARETGGRALVVGEGSDLAAGELAFMLGSTVSACELVQRPVSVFAQAVAELVSSHDVVVVPGSPDGRDLAPRLAKVLGRPLYGVAQFVSSTSVHLLRAAGRQVVELGLSGPAVVTLLARSKGRSPRARPPSSDGTVEVLEPPSSGQLPAAHGVGGSNGADEPVLLETLAADPETLELSEAVRILAVGAGLKESDEIELAGRVATALGASLGATRVVTDAGLLGHERQIGTTGVAVRPRCYVAFGISGAAQHLGGLGAPAHVVSINLDPSCPMMAMAELAIVADAAGTLRAMDRILGADRGDGD